MKNNCIKVGPELCKICQEITFGLDLQENLEIISKDCAEILGCSACSIRLLDEGGNYLQIKAAYGLSKEYLNKGRVEVRKSLLDRETLQGKVVTIADVSTDPKFQYPEEARREGIVSVISVPLMLQRRAIGVLHAYTNKPHEFTKDEKEVLSVLAFQGAVAIENAKLYQQLNTLYELTKLVTSTLNQDEVLNLVVKKAAEVMDVKGASILLLDRTTNILQLKASFGLSQAYLDKGQILADKSAREVMEGKTVAIEDAGKDPRVQYPEEARREGVVSILAVPLKIKENVIGALKVYSSYERKFFKGGIDFLSALANQAAIAIENARLFEHVKKDYESLVSDVMNWYDWGQRPPKY